MADPSTVRLDLIDRAINDLGYGTPEYHEAVAFLCTIMAKRQWILAEQARAHQVKARARRRKPDG